MKRTSRPPGRIAAVVVALAALVACRIANEDEVSDAGADAGAAPTPKACASNQDCAGACPAGSLDCACAAMPLGLGCVPTCARTMDCPLGTTCDRQSGVCIAGGIGERDGGMMGERDAGPGPGPGLTQAASGRAAALAAAPPAAAGQPRLGSPGTVPVTVTPTRSHRDWQSP